MKYLLLKTDASFEVVNVVGDKLDALQGMVGGNVTMLPRSDVGNSKFLAYANGEGVLKELPTNGWSAFLHSLGFTIPWMFGGVWGNVALREMTSSGNPKSASQKLVDLVADMKGLEGEGAEERYLERVEEYAKPPGVRKPTARKRRIEGTASEAKAKKRARPADEK